MIIGTLENDARRGGWALLTVPLADEDGPVKAMPGPWDRFCLVSVRDAATGSCLQGPSSETRWDTPEILWQVPWRFKDADRLVLTLPPDITCSMAAGFFRVTVKCEAGTVIEVMVQAGQGFKTSVGPSTSNYALADPEARVVYWLKQDGDAPREAVRPPAAFDEAPSYRKFLELLEDDALSDQTTKPSADAQPLQASPISLTSQVPLSPLAQEDE
ncbi:MAG: hypothetical protein LBR80_09920 [Deltaproteobacteria bacterium]|jgi:hypothetical protein|nr:hypothetical protein [Deltaproteobacteria bacterium]